MKQHNRFRDALKKGKIALGACIDSYSPAIAEVGGYSGLDFIRIDTEYSWRRDDSLEHMMRAAIISGVTPMVRVEKGEHYLISKALQIGAGAIVVSDIETVEETKAVIKASKFAPKGARGYSSFSFSAGWGTQGGKKWIDRSNDEIPIGIMVENRQIIEQIDEVLSLEGIDFCLFGPADYCMSLNLGAPQKGHPEVLKALKKTIAAANRYDKAVGIGMGKPFEENVKKYKEMGCRFLEFGHDLSLLKQEWSEAKQVIDTING